MDVRQTRSMTKPSRLSSVDSSPSLIFNILTNRDNPFIGYNPDEEPDQVKVGGRHGPLHTASDFDYLSPRTFEGKRHVIRAVKLLIARQPKKISTSEVKNYLMVPGPFKDENHEIMNSIQAGANKLLATYRREAFNFFADGIIGTRRTLDSELFDAVSKTTREAIWETLFDRADFRVARAMLGRTYAIINLEVIIDGEHEPSREKCKAFLKVLRHLFVQGAEAMVEQCPKNPIDASQAQRNSWYAAWEAVYDNRAVRSVWQLENLPVRYPDDTGRGPFWPRFVEERPYMVASLRHDRLLRHSG